MNPGAVPIVVAVALGGAMGACIRAFVYMAVERFLQIGELQNGEGESQSADWAEYPHGTFLVNAGGSLLLGLLAGLLGSGEIAPETHRLLGTGFCGALTTYSTFANDAVILFERGQTRTLVAHVSLNVGLGFAAAAIGLFAGARIEL